MPVLEFPQRSVLLPCFVRERCLRADGFVEFDFAIGDPELSVELILPLAAFKEFCEVNRVRHITDSEAAQIDAENAKWRTGLSGSGQ